MSTVAFIFARGGSKGLPGKNIKELGGVPLIGHAIQCAKACNLIDEVIVSTDDRHIADVAEQYGALVPFVRPQALAQDNSPEWSAWQHAIEWYNEHRGSLDIFVSVPTTSPLRNAGDLRGCIELFEQSDSTDVVITVRQAERSPYFNMVTRDTSGRVRLVIEPESTISTRQRAPEVYDMTTVAYVADPSFILKNTRLFDGRVEAFEVPVERAIDIDTAHDFRIAEFLYQSASSSVSN